MRVGTLAYATDQGLGILAKSFYDNGIVTDALIVRHEHHETHDDWFGGAMQLCNLRSHSNHVAAQMFCRKMDVMLFFETPFIWELVAYCREFGIKTVIMPMHECMPERVPHRPDLWLCPSLLDLRWADKIGSPIGYMQMFLPVPVQVPWRQRSKANVFVHNAGHGGLKGRNGTMELMEAIQYLKSDAVVMIRSQKPLPDVKLRDSAQKVIVTHGTWHHHLMFADGDVFVFPEKFNGLSLPLQEARAAGMLVMCGNRYPMNEWLPREPLIEPMGFRKNRIGPPYSEFDEAGFDPKTIASTIDAWYGQDITEYSLSGREWAEQHSWKVLGPQYKETLENLCQK